jgi:hypothetical protein
MSKEAWFRHFERRMAEADEAWPYYSERTRETWAELMARQDTADEAADRADRLVDAAKDRGL